ncbi:MULTISPECIES: hypothetical protein [unclassified Cryobacterium]|nr:MULTISPECIES: hypothetical protein [unclassified Cryobacterium]
MAFAKPSALETRVAAIIEPTAPRALTVNDLNQCFAVDTQH